MLYRLEEDMDLRFLGRLALVVIGIGTVPAIAAGAEAGQGSDETVKNAIGADVAKGAAQGKAAPAIAGSETAAILDRMDSLVYTLPRAGVKKASSKGRASISIDIRPPVGSDFTYEWDAASKDGKGKFTFANASEVGRLNSFVPELIEGYFRCEPWREVFAGCRLEASMEGGKTVIKVVEGVNKKGIKTMTLGDQGHVEAATMSPPDMPQDIKAEFEVLRIGGYLARRKTTLGLNQRSTEFVKVKAYTVPSKITSKELVPMAASTTVTLTDWHLDGGSAAGGKAGEPKKTVQKTAPEKDKKDKAAPK